MNNATNNTEVNVKVNAEVNAEDTAEVKALAESSIHIAALSRSAKLDAAHAEFDCGSEPLNRYFKELVTQDISRNLASCFVAYDLANESSNVPPLGYYTLSSASVAMLDLPIALTKKLPRYPSVPAVRLGRLAVSAQAQGTGLGGVLLVDAIQRTQRSDIAAYAMVVDAKDEAAVRFYEHFGFVRFASLPSMLYLRLS
jgi:ribosomal protein S18 acetylase RimI-like enzyme